MVKKWQPMTEAEFERQNKLATARGKRAIRGRITRRAGHISTERLSVWLSTSKMA